MKKPFLLFIILSVFTSISAQEITFHLGNESLKSLWEESGVSSVEILNITGKPTPTDYTFLSEKWVANGFNTLNLREADIDTIPAKAFYCEEEYSGKIILPEKLVYIGDSAFYFPSFSLEPYELNVELEIVVSGKFPKMGITRPIFIRASEGNEFFQTQTMEKRYRNQYMNLSLDGKIMYYSCLEYDVTIPEGVEIIEEKAFQNMNEQAEIYFPSTLREIKDSAFYNISYTDVISMYRRPAIFYFYTNEPPILGKDVFSGEYFDSDRATLYVKAPNGTYESYLASDEQWGVFQRTSGIIQQEDNNLRILEVRAISGTISCTSPTATLLEVYTPTGIKVGEAVFQNGEAVVKVGSNVPSLYLYVVTYPDGTRSSGKMMRK